MSSIADMISNAINTEPLTFERMKAAIEALERPVIQDKSHPLYGIIEVKECASLKGTETVVISGDKAYYWPDVLNLKQVKVLKLPDPELEKKLCK